MPHWNGVLNPPHFAPRAKRIIWPYMAAGMTHIDMFDNKPKMAELDGARTGAGLKQVPRAKTGTGHMNILCCQDNLGQDD